MKVRAITDKKIKKGKPIFYRLSDNREANKLEWVKE
jgi:hypothetical protein